MAQPVRGGDTGACARFSMRNGRRVGLRIMWGIWNAVSCRARSVSQDGRDAMVSLADSDWAALRAAAPAHVESVRLYSEVIAHLAASGQVRPYDAAIMSTGQKPRS